MQNTASDNSLNQYTDNTLKQSDEHLRQSGRIFLLLAGMLFSALWLNSPEDVLFFHKLLGTILGILTLSPLYLWIQSKEKTVPFIELIALHYFFIFCPPVFIGPVKFIGATQASVIQDKDLTMLLLIVLLGIICLYLGYYAARLPKTNLFASFHLNPDRAVTFFLIYLCISSISPILIPRLPIALLKVGDLFFRVNGSVATYALSVYMYSGKLLPQQKRLYLLALGFYLSVCLSGGWLGIFVFPMVGFFLGEVQVTNRIPWGKVISALILIIILQASKSDFRETYWGKRMGAPVTSVTESFSRSKNWLEMAFANISSLKEGTTELAQVRANHLSFFGHVIRTTPKYIPFLDGYSYKYVPAMFVPRFFWRDKPSTMLVTNKLALRYGWQSENMLGKVALSPGLMDEAYMNFGIIGVICVMPIFGIFIRWLMDNVGNPVNGFGWQLVIIGFMFGGGLMITWISPSYLGGLWQTIVVIALLYWPLRVKPGNSF
ncbi:MAG: hypothetical protein GY795_38505 [Desulfobacterales bacterium]|nr:hypothetical protein [Desulfobacterales bacterium]